MRIRVGDCFAIPLPNSRCAYCQYIKFDSEFYGYLIKVFDKTTLQVLSSADELQSVSEMFPPVFVGLRAMVSSGRWKFIGRLPVSEFKFPMFRHRDGGLSPGTYDDWSLWNGEKREIIGRLPPELRSLELEIVWSGELLEERIATRINPYAEAK